MDVSHLRGWLPAAPHLRPGKKMPLVRQRLRLCPFHFRGSTEYLSGRFLLEKGLCPWSYGKARWNIGKVIRLDYAPCWFATGLLMEQAISPSPGREALTGKYQRTCLPILRKATGYSPAASLSSHQLEAIMRKPPAAAPRQTASPSPSSSW